MNAIFYNAMLLTGSNLLLRLVAMGFQVYISGRIGAAGVGLLQLILAVHGLFFTVGSAGNRTCTTYLTAEELGRGQPVRAVLHGCLGYSTVCGVLAAGCMWYFAPTLARVWVGDAASESALRLCALFLPVKCLQSAMTGFLTSARRVKSLVAANFLEQGCVMAATYAFLAFWPEQGRACLGIVAGSGVAAVMSFCILLVLCRQTLPPWQRPRQRLPLRRILRTALPLALADNLRSGLNTIENLMVPRRLALYAGTVDALADYGVVCGMVFPVLMFPSAILFSLGDLLIPELSRCASGGRRVRVRYLVRRSLRIALLFGLCTGGVLYVTAGTLGELLYHDAAVGTYLRLYAPLVPMLYLDIVVDAMCKGLGQHHANARFNTFTSFVDVTALWILLPRMGLAGYYFSFAASHLINFGLSLHRLVAVSGADLAFGLLPRAALSAAFAAAVTSLLPERAGIFNVLQSGAIYLLIVGLAWVLLRVTGREDADWLCRLMRS